MPELRISFCDVDAADGNMLVQELEDAMKGVLPDHDVQRIKDDGQTQDFGSTLVLVFGTPVAIIVARAISDYLRRNSGVSLKITKDGAIVANNLDSSDAARIAEALGARSK